MLNGRSPLIDLVNSLPPSSYFTQVDTQQRLTHLLIISSSAKEICSKYSAGSVWLIDATYKTNMYGLPLLYIVGVSATRSKFTFAYCFMRNENVVDYLWACAIYKKFFRLIIYNMGSILSRIGRSCADERAHADISQCNLLALLVTYQQEYFCQAEESFLTLDAWEKIRPSLERACCCYNHSGL